MEVVPDAFLVDLFTEDSIEDKEFPALGRIDGEVGRGGNLRNRALETLGN